MTAEGYKKIEDISAGDKVLTHNNVFQRVVSPMHRAYKGVVYKISAPVFCELICTENHPFYVREATRNHTSAREFSEPKWLSPKEMMRNLTTDVAQTERKPRGYFLGIAVNNESRLPIWHGGVVDRWGNIENKLSPLFGNKDFWYLMGRYVGDGWKRQSATGNGIIIRCGGRNESKLVSALQGVGWHYTLSNERTCRKYVISMNELYDFVERYGYYAHGKKIDGETFNLPVDLLLGFLEGIKDSDGCYSKGLYKVTSVSEQLVYGIGQCVAKCCKRGYSVYKTIRPRKTIIEGRVVNQKDTWTVTWKEYDSKQDRMFYEDGYVWAPIMKMEWSRIRQDVYNMEVENDNSYTANGVIVHNCQSISNAGLQHGFEEGSGTRSSLLWECKRAIDIKKPRFLLMENVKALLQKKFKPTFQKWCDWLTGQGYANFYEVLNSKHYGVPQNRERVFMVSIRKDPGETHPYYEFPEPFPLTRRLKDVLDKDVDESYYLRPEQVKAIVEHCDRKVAEGCGFKTNFTEGDGVSGAIKTTEGHREYDTYIKEKSPVTCAQRGRAEGQQLEMGGDVANALTTVQKDSMVAEPKIEIVGNVSPVRDSSSSISQNTRGWVYDESGIIGCLTATDYKEPKIVKQNEPTSEEE